MKAATVHEIKKALQTCPPNKLVDLCLRLAKYKKESKELLTYLLFEAHDETSFVNSVKSEMDDLFETINRNNLYWTKKGLRKVLRFMDKNIRYSGSKETEVELRIYYCQLIRDAAVPIQQSKVLTNLFERQIVKIKKALSTLHEDLQADFQSELEPLLKNH